LLSLANRSIGVHDRLQRITAATLGHRQYRHGFLAVPGQPLDRRS
jgi:hypothetical protein